MKPEMDELQRHLERATAPGSPNDELRGKARIQPGDSPVESFVGVTAAANKNEFDATEFDANILDADVFDAESMRESWLRLGELIEAADRESCGTGFVELPSVLRDRPRPRKLTWLVACTAGLCALAIAGWSVSLGTSLMGTVASRPQLDNTLNPSTLTKNDSTKNDSTRYESTPNDSMPNDSRLNQLAWDDALDDQLTRAHVAIFQLGGSPQNHDVRWRYLEGELEQFGEELIGDSL